MCLILCKTQFVNGLCDYRTFFLHLHPHCLNNPENIQELHSNPPCKHPNLDNGAEDASNHTYSMWGYDWNFDHKLLSSQLTWVDTNQIIIQTLLSLECEHMNFSNSATAAVHGVIVRHQCLQYRITAVPCSICQKDDTYVFVCLCACVCVPVCMCVCMCVIVDSFPSHCLKSLSQTEHFHQSFELFFLCLWNKDSFKMKRSFNV